MASKQGAKKGGVVLRQLGKRLRHLREERGLTQAQVAEGAGFSAKFISEIERGLRDLRVTRLRRIVEDALGSTLQSTFVGVTADDALASELESTPARVELPGWAQALAGELAELPAPRRREVLGAVRAMLRAVRPVGRE